MLPAPSKVRAIVFSPSRAPTEPGDAATSRALPFLRPLTHASSRPPELVPAWRNPTGKSALGYFFDEAEAQRLTLSPRLPHHRHPMTADEALAGIVLALACLSVVIYLIARWVA